MIYLTDKENELINDIMMRAAKLNETFNTKRISLLLDLQATHINYGLDLEALFHANDFNFMHDVSGIWNHFDRVTKRLDSAFTPRFLLKSKLHTIPYVVELFDAGRSHNVYKIENIIDGLKNELGIDNDVYFDIDRLKTLLEFGYSDESRISAAKEIVNMLVTYPETNNDLIQETKEAER